MFPLPPVTPFNTSYSPQNFPFGSTPIHDLPTEAEIFNLPNSHSGIHFDDEDFIRPDDNFNKEHDELIQSTSELVSSILKDNMPKQTTVDKNNNKSRKRMGNKIHIGQTKKSKIIERSSAAEVCLPSVRIRHCHDAEDRTVAEIDEILAQFR